MTNNHVIDGSDEVVVVLNDKREFTAKVVGADPTTDLALLKLKQEDLSYLNFGDSRCTTAGRVGSGHWESI